MKNKTVGVICAMEKEAQGIREELLDLTRVEVGALTFDCGRIGDCRVVLAVCGIGKVFAAMCAQTMILKFSPDCLINTGVAGSLSPELEILDLAVSTELAQHDMDTSPLGDPVGLVSGVNRIWFPASEDLSSALLRLAGEQGIRAVGGRIVSGDQFVATGEVKERIRRDFSPLACEMEGAAVAQVAFVNRVPFVVLRAISDSYSGKNEMDYAVFSDAAAKRSAALILSFLRS